MASVPVSWKSCVIFLLPEPCEDWLVSRTRLVCSLCLVKACLTCCSRCYLRSCLFLGNHRYFCFCGHILNVDASMVTAMMTIHCFPLWCHSSLSVIIWVSQQVLFHHIKVVDHKFCSESVLRSSLHFPYSFHYHVNASDILPCLLLYVSFLLNRIHLLKKVKFSVALCWCKYPMALVTYLKDPDSSTCIVKSSWVI